ncbi:MAG: DUF5685 family protein [Cellulosilyticaceae bacterium]
MFGYVTPLKDELKVKQYEDFRSYYCGLCQHIKTNYGQLPRLTLNYDLTALALLLDGLSPDKTYVRKQPCLTHPLKKKPMIIHNQSLSYSADMNVALVYYKLLDDVQDDKDLKSKLLSTILKPYKDKFSPELLPILTSIESNLQKLYDLEIHYNFSSLDEICDPFARIVGEILQLYPYPFYQDSPDLRGKLYQFGYALGKWIYIIDALDDLKKDMEQDKFNPLFYLYHDSGMNYQELFAKVKEPVSFTLLNCGFVCRSILSSLPLVRNKVLLHNIVVLGMMEQYTKVTSHCNCCSSKGGSQN